MVRAGIAVDQNALSGFCRKHHIRKLSFFGSVTRPDFGSKSDVDVLVEFQPGHVPGLAFFDIQDELSQLLGRPVDLNTPGGIGPYFRDRVLTEAETAYVES